MFDFVHNNRGVVAVALGLVALGLMIGGGMAGYSASGGDDFLAKVDGVKLGERELAEANGGRPVADAMKPQAVEQLIQRQVLLNESDRQAVRASDALLRDYILGIAAFKDDKGQFDHARYETALAAQQQSVAQFEARVAETLRLRQLAFVLANTSFGSRQVNDRLIQALAEPRTVQSFVFSPDQYLPKVSVSEAEIKQYYDGHQADYRLAERVKLSYALLSQDDLAQNVTVTAEEIKAYYDAKRAELAPEERNVRHILIKADAKAPAAEKAAAKQKAAQLLAKIKQSPASFADLAKQHSDDTGSAAQGGDLGYFGRGVMVKAFDEVAFKLAKDELSDLVETDFGFHILQMVDSRTKSLEELKPVIEQRLRQETVQKRFQAEVDKFTDLVYQQADSLQPAAAAFKISLRESDWMTREASADPLLNHPKLREAVFADDVLNKKHNSEAVEVAPGRWISARITAHEPGRMQAIGEVSAAIAEKLKREKAVKLAQAEGKKTLASLQAGQQPALAWSPERQSSRLDSQGFGKAAVEAMFSVPKTKLPGFAGFVEGETYTVLKVAAAQAQPLAAAEQANLASRLGELSGQQDFAAYMASLRKQQKVEVRTQAAPQP
ncbi:peptidylprolyl isomerase [Chitinimonas sp. BJYL2]|uniref:peptidylprolyl isomerase n=1 Tax=Chitinimonas sp. BJYL2 TaxID=2976696 RepID=UPI0022B323AA|nr:peptidylprolyl isomerase [Chitinimonas sp. BJYL2]